MAEETVVAATSAAAVEATKFTQFDGWDEDGSPVVSKKAEPVKEEQPDGAESAAADTSKETKSEDAADSAAKPKQETRRKPEAEARIKELAAQNKQLAKDLEEARKPKETKAESSPARQNEQKPAQPEATRPKPTLGDKDAEGKAKYGSYEAFQEDLTDWKVEQKLAVREREQQVAQQSQKWLSEINEARGRYSDYDTVAVPLVADLMKPEVSESVRSVLMASPVLADLLYTIGGTEASKADFLNDCRTDPAKALRKALLIEQEIVKELGKGKVGEKKDGETEVALAAPKPRAPKPPAEVGGRGAPGEDALIAAARSNNFRLFDAEQTKRALASRR